MAKRPRSKDEAIAAQVADLEALIARGSIDKERLNSERIFTLVTHHFRSFHITKDDVREWLRKHRPDIS